MNNFEWIKDYYKVPAQFGRDVTVGGKLGTISEDMGTYIGVIFKDNQKSYAVPCHPTSEVVYLDTFNTVKPLKISRSKQRYLDYLSADSSLTFKEWLGIGKHAAVFLLIALIATSCSQKLCPAYNSVGVHRMR